MDPFVITLVTSNEMKRREFECIAKTFDPSVVIKCINVETDEIQSTNVENVASAKIDDVCAIMGRKGIDDNEIVIIDDTGLEIDGMNGFPGALIKFYIKSIGAEAIVERDGGSKAKAITCLGVMFGTEKYLFTGTTDGSIVEKKEFNMDYADVRSNWDVVFVPELDKSDINYGATFYDMDPEIKNTMSPRYKAIKKLMGFIASIRMKVSE